MTLAFIEITDNGIELVPVDTFVKLDETLIGFFAKRVFKRDWIALVSHTDDVLLDTSTITPEQIKALKSSRNAVVLYEALNSVITMVDEQTSMVTDKAIHIHPTMIGYLERTKDTILKDRENVDALIDMKLDVDAIGEILKAEIIATAEIRYNQYVESVDASKKALDSFTVSDQTKKDLDKVPLFKALLKRLLDFAKKMLGKLTGK